MNFKLLRRIIENKHTAWGITRYSHAFLSLLLFIVIFNFFLGKETKQKRRSSIGPLTHTFTYKNQAMSPFSRMNFSDEKRGKKKERKNSLYEKCSLQPVSVIKIQGKIVSPRTNWECYLKRNENNFACRCKFVLMTFRNFLWLFL